MLSIHDFLQGSRSDAVYEYGDDTCEPLLFRFKKHRRKKVSLVIKHMFGNFCFCP